MQALHRVRPYIAESTEPEQHKKQQHQQSTDASAPEQEETAIPTDAHTEAEAATAEAADGASRPATASVAEAEPVADAAGAAGVLLDAFSAPLAYEHARLLSQLLCGLCVSDTCWYSQLNCFPDTTLLSRC